MTAQHKSILAQAHGTSRTSSSKGSHIILANVSPAGSLWAFEADFLDVEKGDMAAIVRQSRLIINRLGGYVAR